MKTNIKLLTAGLMLCLLQLLTMPVIHAAPPSIIDYDASKIIQPLPDADISGVCEGHEDSIHWAYTSSDKVLQIWGNGLSLYYFDYSMMGISGWLDDGYCLLPWQAVREYVKVAIVHEGITGLGSWCFKDFINLEKLVLPNSLKYNYEAMVMRCPKLKEIRFGSDTDFIPAQVFFDNGVERLFLKKIPLACYMLGLTNQRTPYDNTSYPYANLSDTKRVTTIVPLNLLDSARASVVLQHDNNTIISEYEYYAAGGAYDTTRIPVTVTDTTHVEYTVTDTAHVEYVVTDTTFVEYTVTDTTHVEYVATDTVRLEVADTVYIRHVVEYTDTVYHTEYKTEYDIIFVSLEIKTGIYPYPEETETPFLYRLTPSTFRSSSPYNKETLYFYNISGELADKVTYYGDGTVQTSRPLYHTVIAVSDRGWYQVIR